LRKGIKSDPTVLGLVVLVTAYEFYSGKVLLALITLTCLLGWFVYLIWRSLPSIYYRKLILAADWYRWDEVLSLVKTLDRLGRLGLTKIPASELTRHRATAFAGTGQLDKALADYQQCEGQPDCPTWLYRLFVGSLYMGANQHDQGIEYNLLSLKEKSTSAGWADLAYRYARYKRDPVKARNAMAQANKSPVTDLAKPFYLRCTGVIGYLEGNYPTARHDLEQAIQLVENIKWRPYKDGDLAISRAYLCCVLAKLGDFSGAKNCLGLAMKYLVATKEDDLLAECRKLVGK
jgi:tetratricopeptide (TPR) repeat protein